MPMIQLTTSAAVTPENAERLKVKFGQAISLLPGKSESKLMISMRGETPMFFQGEKRGAAFVEVSCFGQGKAGAYESLTAALCEILKEELSVDPGNIFIKYSETPYWGFNGRNL